MKLSLLGYDQYEFNEPRWSGPVATLGTVQTKYTHKLYLTKSTQLQFDVNVHGVLT